MKFKEIKALSQEDREKKLAELKMSLLKLNLQVSTGTTLKKLKEIRDKKKDIAKLLTLENQQTKLKKVVKKTKK
jgi:ribosomal protein L29